MKQHHRVAEGRSSSSFLPFKSMITHCFAPFLICWWRSKSRSKFVTSRAGSTNKNAQVPLFYYLFISCSELGRQILGMHRQEQEEPGYCWWTMSLKTGATFFQKTLMWPSLHLFKPLQQEKRWDSPLRQPTLSSTWTISRKERPRLKREMFIFV